jgi:DNA-directed RNA polymerase specialized sigma subunit
MARSQYYIDPEELYNETIQCQRNDILSERLVVMFDLLIERLLSKNYYKDPMDREDCKSTAMLYLLDGWRRFDARRTTNTFSFYTAVIKNAVVLAWNKLHPKNLKTTQLFGDPFDNDYA